MMELSYRRHRFPPVLIQHAGDRVAAENLYQHAEHYFRVMNAADEAHHHPAMRPKAPADLQTEMSEEERSEMVGPARASPSDRQPYSA
jgi:hypothetical protein